MKKTSKNMDKIVFIAAAMFGMVFFSGCGKTELEDVVDNPGDFAVVYLRQALDVTTPYVFPVRDEDYSILLNANYGGVDYPGSDITVGLNVMPELVTAYNEENNTNYPALPADCYTLEQTSTVIPKGKLYSTSVNLKINTMNMPGIASHLLPVGISSVSDGAKQSENLSVAYLLIGGTFTTNPYPFFDRTSWDVSASSVNGSNSTARLIDSDTTTYWSSSLSASRPHEILVDLKESQLVHGCEIDARRAAANLNLARESGNPIDVEVLTSEDNVNWNYSNRFALTYKSASSKGELDKPRETLFLDYAQDARYVKIRIHASIGVSYAWFSELNIF